LWLKHKPDDKDWFLNPGEASPIKPQALNAVRKTPWKLHELCQWLCPASEVTIKTESLGQKNTAVSSRDWVEIDGIELLRRALLERNNLENLLADKTMLQVASCLRLIKDSDGTVLGRATLIPQAPQTIQYEGEILMAIHLAGPFRSFPTPCLLGFFRGGRVRLNRVEGHAIKISSEPIISKWATEQARLASKVNWNLLDKTQIAGLVRTLAGDTSDLPIARIGLDSLLSINDIKKMDFESEVRLVSDYWGQSNSFPNEVRELPAGTLGTSFGRGKTVANVRLEDDPNKRSNHPIWEQCWMSLWAAVVEGIALSWNVPLDEVLAVSKLDIGRKTEGSIETGDFSLTEGYDLIVRP